MRVSQRLLVELSEVREQINGFPDDGEKDKLDALTTQYGQLESRYRAALVSEDAEDATANDGGPVDAERAEVYRLARRAAIADYLREADGATLTGAALELRQAVFGEDLRSYMPLEMLELRADAVSNIANPIQDNQMPIAPRVFAQSALGYLGIATPTVPVGTTSYPRLSAGTSADIRSDGVEVDGTAANITNEQINPVRLTASYTYGEETLQRILGFEEALRGDIQSTLQDKQDALGINGQAAVANVSPAFEGLLSALTDPAAPTAVAAYGDYLAAFDDAVDGKFAMTSDQVRLLVNAETFKQAMGLRVGTGGAAVLFRDQLPASRFRVSANLPAAVGDVAQAISYAAGAVGLARGFVMPTWAGVQLIVDPYTKAKAGQRILTAVMFVGGQMVDAAAYKQINFQLA